MTSPSDNDRRSQADLTEDIWGRVLARIGKSARDPGTSATNSWVEPAWEAPAPGISSQLLSSDSRMDRVAMLVRLAPGDFYPPYSHSGIEQWHLGQSGLERNRLYLSADYGAVQPAELKNCLSRITGSQEE